MFGAFKNTITITFQQTLAHPKNVKTDFTDAWRAIHSALCGRETTQLGDETTKIHTRYETKMRKHNPEQPQTPFTD